MWKCLGIIGMAFLVAGCETKGTTPPQPSTPSGPPEYAVVRQTGPDDCGPAALATIALHHRQPADLERLRELVGVEEGRGSTLLRIKKAAETLGFSAKGYRLPYEDLLTQPLPAIAHVEVEEKHHFIVLHRVEMTGLIVADPACGIRRMSRDEFSEVWTGVVLVVVPTQGEK